MTHDYVVLASDRRLTFSSGPHKGQIADDNTCKLVSLCGVWGIGYTGFAQLEGIPTHEWIAKRLAEQNCTSAQMAMQILAAAAAKAMKAAPFSLELTFLVAGWAKRASAEDLTPQFIIVSNVFGIGAARKPGIEFLAFERHLESNQGFAGQLIGQPLRPGRGKYLSRAISRMAKHGVGPKPVMDALVHEIANTPRPGTEPGEKVLAFSISKAAARESYRRGGFMLLAAQPDRTNAAFCYFDPQYSQLQQFGPTSICGSTAVTDLETKSEPSRDYQSSSVRILHLPKGRPPKPAQRESGRDAT